MFSQGTQRNILCLCCHFTGRVEGECTIERVALVMNIVPCRELNLYGLALGKTSSFFDLVMSWISTDKKVTT